jgi:NADH-quinone oxidoreductase subunit L
LLFLGAGAVIHAVHSNDMSDMGGLRRHMPTTYRTFVVGSLALAGIIPFAGFWSKDEILATLGDGGYTLVMWIAVAGAFVTAFYMARVIALTFHGEFKGQGEPHEAPSVMTRPMVALAIPSAIIGFVNIPGIDIPGIGNFTEWLSVRAVPMGDHHATAIDWGLAALGLLAAGAGLVAGWLIFSRDRATQRERDSFEVPLLYPLLRHGYFVDDAALGMVGAAKGPIARFVDWTNTYVIDGIVNGVALLVKALGSFVYGSLDQKGVDGVVHGLSAVADGAGSALRKIQTGRVQQYAASFVAGALILVVVFVLVI